MEKLNKTRLAIDDYNTAIGLDSTYSDAYFGRAIIYNFTLKDYKKAIENYSKVLKLHPEYDFIYVYRAEVYFKLNEIEKARYDLSKSILSDDKTGSVYNERAELYYKLGDYNEACSDYTQALIYNNNQNYHFSRGIAYTRAGMYKAAESDYLEFLKFNQTNQSAYNNLAYCYLDEDDYQPAEKYFKRTLEIEPKHVDSFLGLSIMSYRQRKIKMSKEYMYSAMKITPALEKGMKGINKMEKEGYFWNKREKDDMLKIFTSMGIDYKVMEKKQESKSKLNHPTSARAE